MRGDGVVTRRTSLFLGISLAVLGSATMASAQGMPPPPPPPVGVTTAQPTPAQQPTPPPAAPLPEAAPRAPGAGAPPGYPVYPPAMMIAPSRLPYSDGEPIPPGYEIKTRPRMGLAKAGIATFVPLYGLSVLFGSVYLGSERGDAKRYGPMLIPVVGPLATIGTAETDEGTLFLVLDAVGQITGATLFIAGMLADEKYLARQTAGLNLRPEVFITPKSIAMRWQF
jgi:hypothetical protein